MTGYDAKSDEPVWMCSNCGERIREGFTYCWKCGTGKPPPIEAPSIRDSEVTDPKRSPNQATRESQQLRYLNIVISEAGIAELNGDYYSVFIRKADVRTIEVKYGWRAERPLLHGVGGMALAGLGILGIKMLLGSDFILSARWGLGFLVFGALGGWLIWEAFRRGYYLHVACARESRKLIFAGEVRIDELRSFVRKIEELGYGIRDPGSIPA